MTQRQALREAMVLYPANDINTARQLDSTKRSKCVIYVLPLVDVVIGTSWQDAIHKLKAGVK